jgi:hypothetical protein
VSEFGVKIAGLRELDRALGRIDKNLRAGLRVRLKGVAEKVAEDARTLTALHTERRTGDLIAGIKPYALSGRAGVRSGAVHRGYNYPRRLEFEGGGERASLYPAFAQNEPELMRRCEQLVSEIEHDFSR